MSVLVFPVVFVGDAGHVDGWMSTWRVVGVPVVCLGGDRFRGITEVAWLAEIWHGWLVTSWFVGVVRGFGFRCWLFGPSWCGCFGSLLAWCGWWGGRTPAFGDRGVLGGDQGRVSTMASLSTIVLVSIAVSKTMEFVHGVVVVRLA